MWLKRCFILCICVLVSLSIFSFQIDLAHGTEEQSSYMIRVRVKNAVPRLTLFSSDPLFVNHPTGNTWFPIGQPDKNPFIISICKPSSSVYYVQVPLHEDNPIKEIQSVRTMFFSLSSLSFYCSFDNSKISLRI